MKEIESIWSRAQLIICTVISLRLSHPPSLSLSFPFSFIPNIPTHPSLKCVSAASHYRETMVAAVPVQPARSPRSTRLPRSTWREQDHRKEGYAMVE